MAFKPELDDLTAFEAKETSHTIPLGWAVLFWGLIVFGVYYLWAYSPALGGWQQTQDMEGASAGTNTLMTILFTAIPTAAAIGLALAQRSRKRRGA
jgi:heme/copper-type cytochrome/quinol oxidase subunit 2